MVAKSDSSPSIPSCAAAFQFLNDYYADVSSPMAATNMRFRKGALSDPVKAARDERVLLVDRLGRLHNRPAGTLPTPRTGRTNR